MDQDFAVVGAIIQLGRCLDLLDTEHTQRLATFAAEYEKNTTPMPENRGSRRSRDCFLINGFCEHMEARGMGFDTVRGLFQEGESIMEGSAILTLNHIQIVVRNPRAIIGLFRPRGFASWNSHEPCTHQPDTRPSP